MDVDLVSIIPLSGTRRGSCPVGPNGVQVYESVCRFATSSLRTYICNVGSSMLQHATTT